MAEQFNYDILFSANSLDSPPGSVRHSKYDFAVAYPDPENLPLEELIESVRKGFEREGKDLASWCAGFVIAVSLDEQGWHEAADEETIASLLLPFMLISGLDEDPALDELWQDRKLVRQMASGIPDLVEELFLRFHAPELADDAEADDQDDN